jgi:hypothetical protein
MGMGNTQYACGMLVRRIGNLLYLLEDYADQGPQTNH